MSKQIDFNLIYWASKPPPVRALQYFPVEADGTAALQLAVHGVSGGVTQTAPDDVAAIVAKLKQEFAKTDGSPLTRLDVAYGLATQGAVLDTEIDIQGLDPFVTMCVRKRLGYTWVPSALQAGISVAPGLAVPGQTSYDPASPIPGSIKVSTAVADYPQFDPPRPVVVPPALGVSPVGDLLHDSMYAQQPWDKTQDGEVTGQNGVPADARGVFQKHRVASAFGFSAWFTKIG